MESQSVVLHDWTTLSQTLDWKLGKLAYHTRGTRLFVNNEVPNLIHQGGLVPYQAAEVLYVSCKQAFIAGTLGIQIGVLELGMGMGLFAVQVLDRFQEMCEREGVDWYDRLVWYATDATPKVLTDVHKDKVFERHESKVIMGQAAAHNPGHIQVADGEVIEVANLRAVFHSYVLCMLPMNLFRIHGDRCEVMMARTVLAVPEYLRQYTHRSVEEIVEIVKRGDPTQLIELVQLHPLFDLELALVPASDDSDLDAARGVAEILAEETQTSDPVWVLDSSGAAKMLREAMLLLKHDGFMLYRDYGPASAAAANQELIYQHYGTTIAAHVNHFALDKLFDSSMVSGARQNQHDDPLSDSALQTRFVSRAAVPVVRGTFDRAYGDEQSQVLQAAVAKARRSDATDCVRFYQEAVDVEAGNWSLLTEAAQAIFRLTADPSATFDFLRRSLAINPWYQATAWDLLAEMFLEAGDLGQAHAALQRSLRINPEHGRVHSSMALLHRAKGELAQAVECAGRAAAWERDEAARTQHRALYEDLVVTLKERRILSKRLRKERVAGGYHAEFSF